VVYLITTLLQIFYRM